MGMGERRSQYLQEFDQCLLFLRGQRGAELMPQVATTLEAHVQLGPGVLRFRTLVHETDFYRVVNIVAAPECLRPFVPRPNPGYKDYRPARRARIPFA